MRISRIYQAGDYQFGETLALSESASHHLSRVLRHSVGDVLRVFNGAGAEFEASITELSKRVVTVTLSSKVDAILESPLNIHLFQGISRREKMDFTLQKAVELGVQAITPIHTERTQLKFIREKFEKRGAHWEGIMISSCEQSGRAHLPTLHDAVPFDQLDFANVSETILTLDPLSQETFSDLVESPRSIALFVGPEGGLSPSEIAVLASQGAKGARLGPRILRTETAGMAAIAILQNQFGDL